MEKKTSYFKFYEDKHDVYIIYDKKILNSINSISDSKYLLVMGYLRKYMTSLGRINLTLNDLIEKCGFSVGSHSNKILNQFTSVIQKMIDENYISTAADLSKLKATTFFEIKLHSKNCIFTSNNYVMISVYEFDKIISLNTKINKGMLLRVYLSIKQHIYSSGTYESHTTFISRKKLMQDCNVSKNTLTSNINTLIDLNLLFVDKQLFLKTNDGTFTKLRYLYALEEKFLKEGIKSLAKFYNTDKIYHYKEIEDKSLIIYIDKEDE